MEPFKIHVGVSKMDAYLTLTDPDSAMKTGAAEIILTAVRDMGIVFGIDENALIEAINNRNWNQPFEIASGKPTQNGEDGYIKFHFKTELNFLPTTLANGSVDFHNLQITQNVVVGQELAELMPPTLGEAGMNVYGDVLPAKAGESVNMSGGVNTKYRDNKKNILISEVDGSVKLKPGNIIQVDTVLHIKNDVDYSTGDLDVLGDVYIGGNVNSGFKVQATGDVMVNGVVEDAIINAGGNVLVRRGFVGSGKGTITVGGDVAVKFVSNQTIIAEGDIITGEESLHAQLKAGKAIHITDGRGTLIGGLASAERFIEVNTAGSSQNILTIMDIDACREDREQIDQIDEDTAGLDKQLEEIMERMMAIMEQLESAEVTATQQTKFRSLEERSMKIEEEKKELLERRHKHLSVIRKSKDFYIKIHEKIFPGVQIKFGNLTIKTDFERSATEYRVEEDRIVVVS